MNSQIIYTRSTQGWGVAEITMESLRISEMMYDWDSFPKIDDSNGRWCSKSTFFKGLIHSLFRLLRSFFDGLRRIPVLGNVVSGYFRIGSPAQVKGRIWVDLLVCSYDTVASLNTAAADMKSFREFGEGDFTL